MNNTPTDDVILQAQIALQRADDVLIASRARLRQMGEELRQAEEEDQKQHAVIDSDIVSIVQDMDTKTIEFLKNTE